MNICIYVSFITVGKEQERLEKVRDQMENEIDELTANLFEVGYHNTYVVVV